MGRLKQFVGGVGQTFANLSRQTIRNISLTPVYAQRLLWLISHKFHELGEKGFGQNAAVYACLRLLCTSVPEPPLIPYVRMPDGEAGEPLPWAHPLRKLIRRPNELMTEYEMWEMVVLHLGIVGRSTWFIERNKLGYPIALWPLRPDRVGPIYASAQDTERVLLGWSYLEPGTVKYLGIPRSDVITYNFPHPVGDSGGIVEGLGPLQVLASEVSADNEATRFVGATLANAAVPGLILSTKQPFTSVEDAKLIKAAVMQDFGGVRRGSPMVIDGETTVNSISHTFQELEFPNLRRISESRICGAFGVPAILVGLLVGLEAGIRATIAEQREFFAETTLSHYWRRLSDQFTNDIASAFADDLVCAFDMTKVKALNVQAAAEFAKIAEAFAQEALTKNEYRDALGYPPRADGDVYIRGIAPGRGVGAPTPAEADEDTPEDDGAGTPPANEDPQTAQTSTPSAA